MPEPRRRPWSPRERIPNVLCARARTRTVEYSAIKEDILLFARTWMYPEGIMIREISQTEKVKYCTISLVSGTKKKKKS